MKDGAGKERRGNQSSPRGRETKLSLAARNSFAPRRNSVHPVNTRKAPRWNSMIMRAGPLAPSDDPRATLYFATPVAALLVSLWHTQVPNCGIFLYELSRHESATTVPRLSRHSPSTSLHEIRSMEGNVLSQLVTMCTEDQYAENTRWQSHRMYVNLCARKETAEEMWGALALMRFSNISMYVTQCIILR